MLALIPRGLLRFSAGRLLRALISLLIFQIILFGLLQALPSTNAATSEGAAMAALFSGPPSGPATGAESESSAEAQPQVQPTRTAPQPDELQALRESGSPEMVALLDEAMGEDARVAQSRAPAAAEPEAAPTVEPAEQGTDPEAGGEQQAGAESEQDEVAAAEAGAAGAESDEANAAAADPVATYQRGLAELRPDQMNLLERFAVWVRSFFSGDLGRSTELGGQPVSAILADKLPDTLILFVPGTIGGFALGIWLGKRVAWRQRGWVDLVATVGGTAFYTSFPPWLAFIMAGIFAARLRWVPVDGLRNPLDWVGVFADFDRMLIGLLLTVGLAIIGVLLVLRLTRAMRWYRGRTRAAAIVLVLVLAALPWLTSGYWPLGLDILHHLALPLATLILLSFGETMLIMRATMSEAMHEGFVFQARATGAAEARIRDHQVAPVAVLPVLTRFVVHLPFVVIGSFFLESRFFIDGIGSELVDAADRGDLPVIMGILSVVGVGLLLAHVTFDVLSAWRDPRKRKVQPVEAA